MQRTRNDHEYEDIMMAVASEESIPKINLTERVMKRIDYIQPSGLRFGKKRLWSRALITGCATLLFCSITVYAASEYIQIRNSSGVVKVQHGEPQPKIYENSVNNKYERRALHTAKPGELIAYYVKGASHIEVSSKELQFAYKPLRISDYSVFIEEMQRTNAPVIPKTVIGYSFDHGTVSPSYPTVKSLEDSGLYKQLMGELFNQAKDLDKGDLVTRLVPWNKANAINATYTKGKAHIGISAILLDGGNVQVEQEPENNVERITVEGRDIIYNNVQKEAVSYHYLNWYNETQDAYYTVSTYGGNRLSFDQLIQLARELIREGL